jgi:site-specific recombinase XerD
MAKRRNGNRKAVLPPISWRDILKDYRLSLTASHYSDKTIPWYLDILNRFFEFLEEGNLLKPVDEVGSRELDQYLVYLQNRKRWPNREHNGKDMGNLSESAIQGHVRAIKAFWGWLLREEYIEKNVLSKYELPHVTEKIIPILQPEQLERILNTIDRNTAIGDKYYCIILLLLDTGMRIKGLVNIKMSDIDLGKGLVTVLGKGRKERVCPFDRITRKAIIRYIKHYRDQLTEVDSPYLFPNSDGGHISINSVQQYMRRLAKRIDIDRLHPHKFRHTSATMAHQNGADEITLQQFMGHSSGQTTRKYTHPQPEDLKRRHNRFSPVANLMGEKL